MVTKENMQTILHAADKPILIEFYTTYCPFCAVSLQELHKLAIEKGDAAYFGIFDVTEEQEFRLEQDLLDIPTFRIYSGAECVAEKSGLQTSTLLLEMLASIE